MGCRCEGMTPEELVLCLAPPPGEHEVEIRISRDKFIVVNNQGVHLKILAVDESLPFVNTFQRPISLENALKLANTSIDRLLCMVIDSLEQASKSGSITSRRLLEACKTLIDGIRAECAGK